MSKIKVLHLTYDMHIGGTEQVIKNLVENCNMQELDMSILCIESPLGPFADDLLSKGINIIALSRKPGFDWKLIRQIRKHIKQQGVDILHCHQYTPWVYGALAAFMTNTKVIFTEHGRFYPDLGTWKRKLINPWLHRITSATTSISKATKEALIEHENLPEKDIQVIYNGIAPIKIDPDKVNQLRKNLKINNDTLILGTIARLDPIKNHIMMLDAFRQVLDNEVKAKLLIVGDGEMRHQIENTIEALNLSNDVILTGYQTKPDAYLALMHIYLLSSLSEGTSMTLLEAMSLGKPCVVTNAGGNPELIFDQKNGLVTTNDNAQEFANAIIQLTNNPDKLKKMSENSKKEFDKRFNVEFMVQQFTTVYKNLSQA